jgi:hypothetical protein
MQDKPEKSTEKLKGYDLGVNTKRENPLVVGTRPLKEIQEGTFIHQPFERVHTFAFIGC